MFMLVMRGPAWRNPVTMYEKKYATGMHHFTHKYNHNIDSINYGKFR